MPSMVTRLAVCVLDNGQCFQFAGSIRFIHVSCIPIKLVVRFILDRGPCRIESELSYPALVWLHLLAAFIWIGGMFFLVLVLVPELKVLDDLTRARLVDGAGRRFRAAGWASLCLLVATGAALASVRGATLESVFLTSHEAGFIRLLQLKLVIVAIILAVSACHDFVIGPGATRLWQNEPDGTAAANLRVAARWMGRVTLVLALAAVWLGVRLVRG